MRAVHVPGECRQCLVRFRSILRFHLSAGIVVAVLVAVVVVVIFVVVVVVVVSIVVGLYR